MRSGRGSTTGQRSPPLHDTPEERTMEHWDSVKICEQLHPSLPIRNESKQEKSDLERRQKQRWKGF